MSVRAIARARVDPAWIRAAAFRVFLAAGLWWVVTEGLPHGPLLGASVVLAVALTSLALIPPATFHLSVGGAMRFISFFARASLVGGWDVARRALRPSMPIDPAWFRIPLRIRDEPAQVFLAGMLCLLPGTLTSEVRGGTLLLHALDARLPVAASVAEAEARVADLFGVRIA